MKWNKIYVITLNLKVMTEFLINVFLQKQTLIKIPYEFSYGENSEKTSYYEVFWIFMLWKFWYN